MSDEDTYYKVNTKDPKPYIGIYEGDLITAMVYMTAVSQNLREVGDHENAEHLAEARRILTNGCRIEVVGPSEDATRVNAWTNL